MEKSFSNGEIRVFRDASRPESAITFQLISDDDQVRHGTPFRSGDAHSARKALTLVNKWLETSYG